MVRGTNYFDDNWLYSGVGERKLSHIMDFIDISTYLKNQGVTERIGVLGYNYSGSLTALSSFFNEPFLFDAVCVYVIISNLIIFRIQ